MKRIYIILFLLMGVIYVTKANAEVTKIYTGESGFCSVVGFIDRGVAGFESPQGYANVNNAEGAYILWSVEASQAGTYQMRLRYAFGGWNNPRNGRLMINESVEAAVIEFVHTGAWTNWAYTDYFSIELKEGVNKIRLVAMLSTGLPNTDFLEITGDDLAGAECLPSYTLSVGKNIEDAGSITFEPVQSYYDEGTLITVRATANTGYFFHSWSGNAPSTEWEHTFAISDNSVVTAMFYPEGTAMNSDIIGYAAIQDDLGTPFMLIGGQLGRTVLATNKEELEGYLDSDEPLVVTVDRKITGTGQIKIRSDKSLVGITDDAHIEGIMMQISNAQNIIIQNMTFSHVVQYDLIEITHGAKNIWIDGCEFYNDRDHHQDYYDGLLDIKNGATHITISRSVFHDHFKSVLISSGDGQTNDHVIRITIHHNYFYNLGSRIPSIRFGKAHIFNNYYKNCGDGINSRMGACVRIENNFFENVGKAIHIDYSIQGGYLQVIDNIFQSSSYITSPECVLDVPYAYEHLLVEASALPALLGDKASSVSGETALAVDSEVFPNPVKNQLNLYINLPQPMALSVDLFSLSGMRMSGIVKKNYPAGQSKLILNTEDYKQGVYFIRVNADMGTQTIKFVVE